mgnify:FL=1
MKTFKLKGREYIHIGNGWCISQVDRKGELIWRIYHGYLQQGAKRPVMVNTYSPDDDGDPVDFDDINDAISWILSPGKK